MRHRHQQRTAECLDFTLGFSALGGRNEAYPLDAHCSVVCERIQQARAIGRKHEPVARGYTQHSDRLRANSQRAVKRAYEQRFGR